MKKYFIKSILSIVTIIFGTFFFRGYHLFTKQYISAIFLPNIFMKKIFLLAPFRWVDFFDHFPGAKKLKNLHFFWSDQNLFNFSHCMCGFRCSSFLLNFFLNSNIIFFFLVNIKGIKLCSGFCIPIH